MTDLSGARVLVLGATGGLGAPITRRLVAAGADVWLSARSGERLAALADELGPSVLGTTAADLRLPGSPDEIVAAAADGGALTGVVLAAGVVAFGDVVDLEDDVLDDLLLLNLIGPIRVVRAVTPHVVEGGFVVQVSAVVAERPMPGMAAYSASKAGLTAFGTAVATELRRRKIRLVDVRPPHTETGLADRPLAGTAPRMKAGLDPDAVAGRIVQAIADGEKVLGSESFTS
ncbi:SDR family NAD(P)-dependent oxidoreductase [Aeromicrobium fastidiosum]|uniref:SDR family NAD(P)-dependent oxidoreductase n=1 Tax=Aeromicrobium fastidiosum TaxID=52699 RepID=A0A641AMK4_9ACTN|nr:SDR family NAD(P)-dependent oxidoreductase [Aeromicrobium fastidiosum]KAA1378086.1 SDR family NAD(P)-dependent oxidoreductase [Aeromicrobium fastidiosum]MBP2389119.1 cyclic-di-GMP-binding biofilm dispersal mediator protein [Aeromicrobium fastidiosum]